MYSKRHWRRLLAKQKNCASEDKEHNENDNSTEENISFLQENVNCTERNDIASVEFKESLTSKLKIWAVGHNISRACFDDLLTILSVHHTDLPASSKTIIKAQSHTCVLRTVSPGSYLHIGLEKQLLKLRSLIEQCDNIFLDINVDGLPLYKSSSTVLWPILARIVGNPRAKVFPIGIYLGKKKPASVNAYLHEFVNELAQLNQTGLQIEGKSIAIKIRSFVCDTPARSFICQIVGHNALFGCSKCVQIGRRINNRTVFSTTSGSLRTDKDFAERKYSSFHTKTVDTRLELEDLGIGMISQFPLDPMHLVDLGVTKKMLTLLLSGKTTKTKLKQIQIDEMSSKLLSLVPFIPREFCRKPRGMDEMKRWKATEFRQFILYTGIVVLAEFVDEDFFYHFSLLHCAYRLLIAEQNYEMHIESATDMLQYFVESFPLIYSEHHLSFNVHSLLHLPQCVADVGFLGSFSSYDFENYLQHLKHQVKKPNQILQQLNNKIFYDNYIEKNEENPIKYNKEGIITSINMPLFFLSLKNPDNYCYIKSGFIVQIKQISKVNNKLFFTGNRILNCTNLYERPIQSQDLGIFLTDCLTCTIDENFQYDDILYKLMRLPFNSKYVFLKIIHSQT